MSRKNKKKALAALLVFTLVFIVVHLLAAFVNLSFDFRLWGDVSRLVVGIIVFCAAFVLTVWAMVEQ